MQTEQAGHEHGVRLWHEPVVIPTYPVPPPDLNPMFIEKRVYQGSSGKVYPNPFTDRVSDTRVDRQYDAVHLENEYIRLMILPEIGGRIHVGLDKTNGYDFFYRQHVIKPALVGLLGPWISGGVEFNWPQHHRPTTFQPVDYQLVDNLDGSKTVWLGEHEPMNRMKGMVGITLHPGRSLVEAKARLYNRTPLPQTFLWWANVAVHVDDHYQSFFPPDVTFVADHAKCAISSFPVARGTYYGVDYSPGTRIDWYKNIPVPTSYMVTRSDYDFFGGYDHRRQAGLVHVANRHIVPGKKQWTWGNAPFGHACDRNLTDDDGPYIELRAGAYTDNQPDFSWLQPYETKTFSQFWYPIRAIGPVKNANVEAALNLELDGDRLTLGVACSSRRAGCTVRLTADERVLLKQVIDVAPERPFVTDLPAPAGVMATDLCLTLVDATGAPIISYRPPVPDAAPLPDPARPVPWPHEAQTNEELYLAGLHLEQYRHATRDPASFYAEALRRNPADSRNNNALGLLKLRSGDFEAAVVHFERAADALTRWTPNPYDGEPFYNLGLARCFLRRYDAAYGAFYKATWNQSWASAAFYALAQLDCRAGAWQRALEHLRRSLTTNMENNKARNLLATVLRQLGRYEQAMAEVAAVKQSDPLDFWCRNELAALCAAQGRADEAEPERWALDVLLRGQAHSYLDLASDYAAAGLLRDARDVLACYVTLRNTAGEPVYPEVHYHLGSYAERCGDHAAADHFRRLGATACPDYCFPSRLESLVVLEDALRVRPDDPRAHYYLGNLLYDKKQYDRAISHWEVSRDLDDSFSIVHRNLGFAYYNRHREAAAARVSLERALRARPDDARVLFELDQLLKLMAVSPEERLGRLMERRTLVEMRDDLYLEYVTLHVLAGRYDDAIQLLQGRLFHPWEGGEGKVPEQYVQAHLLRGYTRLHAGAAGEARHDFIAALAYPPNLGEGKHLLQREAHVLYAAGVACDALGDGIEARSFYERAVAENNTLSIMSYYQALALARLGDAAASRAKLEGLIEYARKQIDADVEIDYFATSLPSFLLFDDDLAFCNRLHCTLLIGLGYLGLGDDHQARKQLGSVLEAEPGYWAAVRLATLAATQEGLGG